MGEISTVQPDVAYESGAFFKGFLEGYNTMDLLASLAFGIIVVNVIKGLGVEDPEDVATCTVKSGVFSCIFIAVIYVGITILGVQSRGITALCSNGGEALYVIANHYFGTIGTVILALTVTFTFTVLAFLIANLGLNSIISYSIPVLMLLYPLAMTLIILTLFGKFFGYDKRVYGSVTAFTFAAAILDFLNTLPEGARALLHGDAIIGIAQQYLPFFNLGMGWICPAAVGLVVGLVLKAVKK